MIFKDSSRAIGTRLRYGLASVIAALLAFGVVAVTPSPAQAETPYPYSDGCHVFGGDWNLFCLEWTGGYPNGYVRARVAAFPSKASVGLQECTVGSCQPGQYGIAVWTLVQAAYNYPSPPVTAGRRVSKNGAYRVCSQIVPGSVWSCMYYSTYLGD
ncbi:hypothetical protein Ais01nite_83330 [Asanoa ishikariensis]|nr:hypothetical protein Ais01nite_83330 [Asanoa ishikariensis]